MRKNRRNGGRMITLKEIAKECNVSTTTVSNILNGKPKVGEETKRKVLEVMQQRGYQPNYIAQGLRRQKTKMIGIIAEDIAQFTTPGIVEGIMGYCEERGYRTIVQNMRLYARWHDSWYDNEKDYHSILDPALQELLSIKVDGVIYIAGHARVIRCFPEDFPVPAVMVYGYTKDPKVPSVVLDDESGAYEMVKYLISKGHRRIGVIGGRADNIHTQKRILGYQKALFEAKILFNPEWVRYAKWDRESGYTESAFLVEAGVTAMFCMSDRMAGGVYQYLEEKGMRVGVDVSVGGFDNQEIAEYFIPGLTTMDLPLREIGQKAIRILLDRIEQKEDKPESRRKVKEFAVPCSLIVRDSVAPVDTDKV